MPISATYVSAASFTIATDRTAEFATGVRVRADCGTDGTFYGTVTASSYASGTDLTTVSLSLDTGELTNNLTGVLHGNDTPAALCNHGHTGPADGGLLARTTFATCETAAATAAKVAACTGFVLAQGAVVCVTFANGNTVAGALTLHVGSSGDKPIADASGNAVSATNPAFFPAGPWIEFVFDGASWLYKRTIVSNSCTASSWCRVYADGWIEQGGTLTGIPDSTETTVTFPKAFLHNPLVADIHCSRGSGSDVYAFQVGVKSCSTTSAVIRTVNNATTDIWWEFKGY